MRAVDAGIDEPDGGVVHRKRGLSLGFLLQESHFDAAFMAAPDLRTEFDRMFFEQVVDDRLRDAQQIGVRGIQALGRGFGDGGEETAGRTLLGFRPS